MATKAKTFTADDVEEARIRAALDIFEGWFTSESDPATLNSYPALKKMADWAGIPPEALMLEVARLRTPCVYFRAGDFAAIEANPVLKRVLIERDSEDDDQEEE